eukprot:4837223-Prymnesium_polylepis.1
MSSSSESAMIPVTGAGTRAGQQKACAGQSGDAFPPSIAFARVRVAALARVSLEHAHARRTLSAHMCRDLHAALALARYLLWPVGCCRKRRHPRAPITLPSMRAPRTRSLAVPALAALVRTRSDPAARARALAPLMLRCLL